MNPVVLDDVDASALVLTAVADDDMLLLNACIDGLGATPHTVKPPSLWCRCCRNHSEEGVGCRQPTE